VDWKERSSQCEGEGEGTYGSRFGVDACDGLKLGLLDLAEDCRAGE
jgi:hypothetical protein